MMMLQLLLPSHIDFILYPFTSLFDMIHTSLWLMTLLKYSLHSSTMLYCVDQLMYRFIKSSRREIIRTVQNSKELQVSYFLPLISRQQLPVVVHDLLNDAVEYDSIENFVLNCNWRSSITWNIIQQILYHKENS